MGIERVMESETVKKEKRKMKSEEERVVQGQSQSFELREAALLLAV